MKWVKGAAYTFLGILWLVLILSTAALIKIDLIDPIKVR